MLYFSTSAFKTFVLNAEVLKYKKYSAKKAEYFLFSFVESEGFEPSSKQGINMLSTCLAETLIVGKLR
jgi:hypothetical protein